MPYADVRLEGYIPHSYQEEILPGVLPGSKMLAVGGITAKVIPKRGVDIKLEEDKERSTNKTIALFGELVPAISGQKLRVELRDPNDQMRFIEAISDVQGQFHALFDLTIKPSFEANSDNGHTKQARQKLQPGIYKTQALVIDSPNAAETESNIVYITKT